MAEGSLNKYELVIIGGSAGSLEAFLEMVPHLPADTGLVYLLVLHRKNSDSVLTSLLSEKTSMAVKEAEEKESIMPGTLYIAPADYHLLIEQTRTFSLDDSEKVNYSRPSIDVSFESAAEVYGPKLIGILLSGANSDGALGLKSILEAGGRTIVQDPQEASVSYMPQSAITEGAAEFVARAGDIAAVVERLQGNE
jgi:two-component system, chemotaxis family, protein-glutamate methylesterase/glutaminase